MFHDSKTNAGFIVEKKERTKMKTIKGSGLPLWSRLVFPVRIPSSLLSSAQGFSASIGPAPQLQATEPNPKVPQFLRYFLVILLLPFSAPRLLGWLVFVFFSFANVLTMTGTDVSLEI